MAMEDESYWEAEYVPAPLASFATLVRNAMEVAVYMKGDTKHRKGRHRSWNWDKYSAYSTNRTYSTTKAKDLTGPRDAIRAVDIMISGQQLIESCRGLDEYVKAGKLPQVAEWFGTLNGEDVAGWFEGKPGTSDDSHLYHLHVGIWTTNVDDVEWYGVLYEAITKYRTDMALTNEDVQKVWTWDLQNGPGVAQAYVVLNNAAAAATAAAAAATEAVAKANEILAAIQALSIPQPAPVDPAALKAVLLDPEVVAALD